MSRPEPEAKFVFDKSYGTVDAEAQALILCVPDALLLIKHLIETGRVPTEF